MQADQSKRDILIDYVLMLCCSGMELYRALPSETMPTNLLSFPSILKVAYILIVRIKNYFMQPIKYRD